VGPGVSSCGGRKYWWNKANRDGPEINLQSGRECPDPRGSRSSARTTEDPSNISNDYGKIHTYRSPGDSRTFGCGFAMAAPDQSIYDSLLVKITACRANRSCKRATYGSRSCVNPRRRRRQEDIRFWKSHSTSGVSRAGRLGDHAVSDEIGAVPDSYKSATARPKLLRSSRRDRARKCDVS